MAHKSDSIHQHSHHPTRCGLLIAARAIATSADTGIVITASHNPEQDNGVKLVEPDGSMLCSAWEVCVTIIPSYVPSHVYACSMPDHLLHHNIIPRHMPISSQHPTRLTTSLRCFQQPYRAPPSRCRNTMCLLGMTLVQVRMCSPLQLQMVLLYFARCMRVLYYGCGLWWWIVVGMAVVACILHDIIRTCP